FPLPGQPANTADAMSIAWAGEMLHIYFYAHGISLPHHTRADFQEEWRAVAAERGMATVPHDDDDEFAHSVIVRYVGYGRCPISKNCSAIGTLMWSRGLGRSMFGPG